MKKDLTGQMLKSIGFSPKLLAIIDAYANLNNNSRSGQVTQILSKYIKDNNIEKIVGIKL